MAKSILLKNIPEDVFRCLLIEQNAEKVNKKKGMFGLEQTIYKIIRDYERCKQNGQKSR